MFFIENNKSYWHPDKGWVTVDQAKCYGHFIECSQDLMKVDGRGINASIVSCYDLLMEYVKSSV